MDQFNASNNSGNKTFSVPLIRMRGGKNATTNILLNPGGPGGSGSEFLYRRGAQLNTILGDGFHLLSFDPRGVNQSRPLADCYPDPETRRNLSPVRAKRPREDSGELWAWSANHVQACADNLKEYGPYINTPQTAADMNSILDAIGQQDMYYWGFSYGTLLGQTYATLFPNRSTRVIIDGVVNQFDWYDSPLDREAYIDTDRVFSGFVSECVKAGPEKCALASMASSAEALSNKLITTLKKLRDDPVPVYINSTVYGVLDYWAVWHDGVFPALYRPPAWFELAQNLASLLAGNATDAFLAYKFDSLVSEWNTTHDALEFVMFNDGLSGPSHFPHDRTSLLAELRDLFSQSMFSGYELDIYFKKRAWPIPRAHDYFPRHRTETAHPLLILSTTYDPICPLVSAKSALAAFEKSRLVEVEGFGHCSVAVPSLCVARHVRNFFVNGTLPEEQHVMCKVDGEPYFVKPEAEGAEVVPLKVFHDDEERKIHVAQLELARGHWLPFFG
ncbi:Alpha/Beta hydrolase protein [Apodospora peruviana]|uniref:Alpha/Beta hydrolase protein n=1 Tax=Apodospora peruviana TaxID=516989 RepID=A0AAE0HV76_9PEZI|nr:Alpha/Beta hydrolase protein [Apodospora peruviana]